MESVQRPRLCRFSRLIVLIVGKIPCKRLLVLERLCWTQKFSRNLLVAQRTFFFFALQRQKINFRFVPDFILTLIVQTCYTISSLVLLQVKKNKNPLIYLNTIVFLQKLITIYGQNYSSPSSHFSFGQRITKEKKKEKSLNPNQQ